MKEILKKVADNMTAIKNQGIEEECPIGIIDIENWEWPQGVGMYGMYKYYKELGDTSYRDFLIKWYDKNIAKGLPERNVNTMCPMLTLAHLAEETGRKDYLDLCTEWAEWVMNEMPRTEGGGIQHIVSGGENHNQVWIDTLFMTVLFLAKMGLLLDRKEYIEEAKFQFLFHIKYLADKKTGFWFHGWTFDGRHNFADALWARGNCWYTAGSVEFIEMLGLEGSLKEYLLNTLVFQVEALAKTQDESGGWHTLLDDPSSYLEASATAGFGYGILKAVRLGYIDEKYKVIGEKALKYVIDNIAEDGEVQSVSYGTGMGATLEDYRVIPICPMTYGQSLALLILTEGVRLK